MQIIVPSDIEDAIRRDLEEMYDLAGFDGVEFSAMPIPPTLGELPAGDTLVCIRRVGGARSSLVVDTHGLSVDVYSSTWGESISEANRVAAVACAMPFHDGLSMHYRNVEMTNPPVELPDTSNPTFPRVRFALTITVKGDVVETS